MVKILILTLYKVDGEISEILRIKEFKLKFPFLKAHSISNIANENILNLMKLTRFQIKFQKEDRIIIFYHLIILVW